MNRQTIYRQVDLTYMDEPDVVIDIMDDFTLQRCDLMHTQDSGTGGVYASQFGIFPISPPSKHRPPMITEFQSLLSAGIQSSTKLLEKAPFFQTGAQKSCKQMV